MRSRQKLKPLTSFAVLVAACALLAIAAGGASAATMLKQQTCHMSNSATSCNMHVLVGDGVSYPCYTRLRQEGPGPYVSKKTHYQWDSGYSYGGAWTTAQTAYSYQAQCVGWLPAYISGGYARGQQSGGGSSSRQYTLQLYSGTL